MEGFLEFLSNYYLYFLIAAGVLFFALLGFLVDLKRNKKNSTEEEVPDLVTAPDVPVDSNVVNGNVDYNQTMQMPENMAAPVDNNMNTQMDVNQPVQNNNINYNPNMGQVVNPDVNQPAPVNYNQNMGGVPNPEVSQPAPANYNQGMGQVPNQNMNMPQPNPQNIQPQNFSNENIEEFK